MKQLTAKEELFAIATANGERGVDAYSKLFPRASRKTATEKASRWARRDNVKARIDEIQQRKRDLEEASYSKATEEIIEQAKGEVLSSLRRRQLLRARAENPMTGDVALATILHLDAKLAGDLIDKVDHTTDGQPLPSVAPQITIQVSPHWSKPRTGGE